MSVRLTRSLIANQERTLSIFADNLYYEKAKIAEKSRLPRVWHITVKPVTIRLLSSSSTKYGGSEFMRALF